MAEFTHIEWCHHTFNGWRGCTKCSAGCAHCYAEVLSGRNHAVLGEWGPRGTRVVAAEAYWREPLRWDRAAKAAGERRRVFAASLSDVFEGADSMPAEDWPKIQAARVRLYHLIQETPNLDWLLLTKRPENVRRFAEDSPRSWSETMPRNVWMGVSVEDQASADRRIPHLLAIPAAVRFLSVEPMLGPVDFRLVPGFNRIGMDMAGWWVIVGGESGPGARPMHPGWPRSIRDRCKAAGVPFLFKQWGEWAPREATETQAAVNRNLRSHQYPQTSVNPLRTHLFQDGEVMVRVGKKAAGRLLDGVIHDGYPMTEVAHR